MPARKPCRSAFAGFVSAAEHCRLIPRVCASSFLPNTLLTFFELVSREGGPFFSPWTTRARFALLAKGVPFETHELMFKDLRFGGWKEQLGVECATGMFPP